MSQFDNLKIKSDSLEHTASATNLNESNGPLAISTAPNISTSPRRNYIKVSSKSPSNSSESDCSQRGRVVRKRKGEASNDRIRWLQTQHFAQCHSGKTSFESVRGCTGDTEFTLLGYSRNGWMERHVEGSAEEAVESVARLRPVTRMLGTHCCIVACKLCENINETKCNCKDEHRPSKVWCCWLPVLPRSIK